MTTENKNNDATRLMNDETRLYDNETALAPESGTQVEDNAPETEYVPESKAAKPARKVDKGNLAAAGIGAVAGGVAGAAVGAHAAGSSKKDIDLKDSDKDEDEKSTDTADDELVNKDIAPDATDAEGKTAETAASDEQAVDVSDNIEHEAAGHAAAPQTVNVEVNINSDSQYQVSGPNPAEAAAKADPASQIHEAGRQMHESYASAKEPEATIVEVEPEAPVADEIPHAHVSDSMSFSEAFAAARAEVGPGGSFTWHGKVYGTYYKNEWDSMSSQEQRDFQTAAINGEHSTAPGHEASQTNNYAYDKPVDPVPAEEPYEEPKGQEVTLVDPEPVSDDEVRVLGIDQMMDEDGQLHEAALIDFGGNMAMVVDTDGDNVYDVMAADFNGDGEITSDEINPNFGEAGLTVGDVQGQYMAQEQEDVQFNNECDGLSDSDFDNSADIDAFV